MLEKSMRPTCCRLLLPASPSFLTPAAAPASGPSYRAFPHDSARKCLNTMARDMDPVAKAVPSAMAAIAR